MTAKCCLSLGMIESHKETHGAMKNMATAIFFASASGSYSRASDCCTRVAMPVMAPLCTIFMRVGYFTSSVLYRAQSVFFLSFLAGALAGDEDTFVLFEGERAGEAERRCGMVAPDPEGFLK